MSSTYGESLKLSIFGQSHGPAIGMTLDGIPAGLAVDLEKLGKFLDRRAPGRNHISTPRREEDRPEFLSGILDGRTCGAPIAAVIWNHNTRSGDYAGLKVCPRPGHADYTAQVKYHGFQDSAGGGHFSGRLTAPLCVAGGLCLQWLEDLGIRVAAHIAKIGPVEDQSFDPVAPDLEAVGADFPVIDPARGDKMRQLISQARSKGDSVGGMIECCVTGLPAGLGDPMFGGLERRIGQIVYGIPAVKGLDFGAGYRVAGMYGSENNDPYTVREGRVVTTTNHAGGILGGITNGMPLIFRVAVKPTPSISLPQTTVSLETMEPTPLQVRGRHDPCIVPRAVPVVEAAAAIGIYDAMLSDPSRHRRAF